MAQKSVIWPCAQIEEIKAYLDRLEATIKRSPDWMLH